MRSGSELYFAQSDNRASGDVIYRIQVKQAGPARLVIAIDNVTAVRRFLITFFEPGDLQSVHYLERRAQGRWSYYGLAWAGERGTECLVVVNYSDHRAQCRLSLPLPALRNRRVRLTDMMGNEVYDRDGSDLVDHGLYIEHAPWHFNVFALGVQP